MLRQMKSVIALLRYCVIALKNKNIFLCILSATFLSLPFSFGKLLILAWFGFVPLFFTLRNKGKLQAFFLAYLCGFVFWWLVIYWLVHVTAVGTLVLILYLSLYFGFFGLFFPYLLHTTYSILALPAAWTLLEYCRSHLLTGFPWALLGYSQYLNLPLIQIADITGAWGVSFAVMMINVAVYSGYRVQGTGYGKRQKIIFPAVCIVIVLIYGLYSIYRTPNPEPRTPIKVSVIQGNIPQELKWDQHSKDFILKKYLDLTAQAAEDKPDLIIWPEASLPVIPEEEPAYYDVLSEDIRLKQIPLLFGAVTKRGDNYYNSALLVSGKGELLAGYDKLHLVPFGEYIPLKKALPFLQTIVPIGDIAAGNNYTVFSHPSSIINHPSSIKFSVLICFEDLFPELSRRFVLNGADFLINITNDAWYKKTTAALQHFQASVFRAVENRRYLVRAANTGISGFIAPSGKTISLAKDSSGQFIFITGHKTENVYLSLHQFSLYTKYGDLFILACLLIILCGIILPRKK
jgi:apolipoprotein N-acyltransferase